MLYKKSHVKRATWHSDRTQIHLYTTDRHKTTDIKWNPYQTLNMTLLMYIFMQYRFDKTSWQVMTKTSQVIIKLCPRGAQTYALPLFRDRDLEINLMTLKLKGNQDSLKMYPHTENEAASLKHSKLRAWIEEKYENVSRPVVLEIFCGQTHRHTDLQTDAANNNASTRAGNK